MSVEQNLFVECGINLEENFILGMIEKWEKEGYDFNSAKESLELKIKKQLGQCPEFFVFLGLRVIIETRNGDIKPVTEATIRLKINNKFVYMAAMGDGPLNALDNALRDALIKTYPSIKNVKLVDYKVRILNADAGTAAKTIVFLEFSNGENFNWQTVGVSENIVQASWEGLVAGYEYKLMKENF